MMTEVIRELMAIYDTSTVVSNQVLYRQSRLKPKDLTMPCRTV